jgi:hypothetical protein
MPINNATFSMKTFMDHVNSANWHFTLAKSSLNPLVQELGGAYVKANGQDQRNLNRTTLENVQGIIWPMGDGIATSPWGLKKKKYKLALGYLAHTLYGVDAADALLVGTYKTGWVRRQLAGSKKFVSASTAKEAEIAASGGLSNRFSTEMCIPTGGMIGDWQDGHKYIFAAPMRLKENGKLASAGAIKGQGFGNNTYCFERDALTWYMCMSDVENTPNYTGEVAFPDDVTRDYIKIYANGLPKPNPLWNAPNWT